MGIQSAMFSGVSGLNTNGQAMSVIGNNLANTNTIGFKGARTVFSDLLSSTIYGSGGFSQVGRGVNVSKVDNIFSQGTFETTSSDTDVAIEGEGFFLLKQPGDETAYYSRAGAFRFDDEGYLVNPEGFRVQGKKFDIDGNLIAGDPTDIQVVNTGLIPANPTTSMTFSTNLDAATPPLVPVVPWDPNDTTTFNYAASTQVYDSLGQSHLISVYFTKTAANTWDWHWSAQDVNGVDVGQVAGAAAAGTLTFNPDGTLAGGGISAVGPINWANGSDPSNIDITFDTTQFDSESVVISQDQDGYGAGNLTNVGINSDGVVIASYSNGEQIKISQLVLGKFKNNQGLELAGANLFTATENSGPARVGLPGPELGQIFTNSLEQSNVDMGQEFVKMISAQRGFQANSKIISTVDELLGELINLKR
ncbi:MAG: flagellar hook protein FlgE [Desulfobulbaceae bacterium]|nr:flagellar hook protein FlgE [Desulfobulbaceae bacterium]